MPAWAACLRESAPDTISSSSMSDAPSRIASRSETSADPKRQTLSEPSAVSRKRLQPAQNGCVMDAMKETLPTASGIMYDTATSFAGVRSLASPGYACFSRSSIASSVTIVSDDQRLPSKGMYSMKRTSIERTRDISANSSSSSSLVPAMRTQLTFRGSRPRESARSIASNTRWSPSRRVRSIKRWRSSVSSDRLSRSSPLATSDGSIRGRAMPLDVIAIWRRPNGRSSFRAETISGRSRRTVGSPPVNRILSTPAPTNSRASRNVSSAVSSLEAGERSTPSAGMQ
mmetsp:Transcript_902/g.1878  ORF Transcript_902/g.1878 Transcript_902/m.1878 type:complete len:286 (+) Transcript_902:415-1272(+)